MNDKKPIKTAISPTRAENFPDWYQEVIKAADMAENAPVRGCMIIKPYGYALWENVQQFLGGMIKECGVENAYFPLLIPLSYISKEAEHIDGFAKECAVVTHHRLEKGPDGGLVPASPLPEPFVIRPTSETVIGEVISSWVNSYRDLPLKLNQWCNVMRWEMRPRMFLRTSEFLWQEGHNCFATAEEAAADAHKMLGVYVRFLREYMAIPGYEGEKTPDERFPGAMATYTYESMMQDGKAVQMCTSHNLGQTFSKGAKIQFLGKDGVQHFAHTTSWGLSTRTIGALIMTHADDNGVVIPPKMASYPIRIIPIARDDGSADKINAYAAQIIKDLAAKGIKCSIDNVDDKPANKTWKAIKQGIPIRLEIGGREAEQQQVTFVCRTNLEEKKTIAIADFVESAASILSDIQQDLYTKAEARLKAQTVEVKTIEEALAFFDEGKQGLVRAPIAILQNEKFGQFKAKYSVTPRCVPFDDNGQTIIMGQSY